MSDTIDALSFTAAGFEYNLTVTVAGTTGVGQIVSIRGTAGSETITGLDPSFAGADDQIVSTNYPEVDYDGVSFDSQHGRFNLYDLNGTTVLVGIENDLYPIGANVQDLQFTDDALCYLRGTRILTTTGEVTVEDLRIGDRLVTRFSGIVPVKWIGRQSFDTRFVPLGAPV